MAPVSHSQPRSSRSGSSSSTAATTLVVHFDINETILMGDPAGGDTRDDCLHKVLAKSAFVQGPPSMMLCKQNDDDDNGSGNAIASKALEEECASWIPTHWWDGTPIIDTDNRHSETMETTTPTTNQTVPIPRPPPVALHTAWEWPDGCLPYYRTAYKHRAKTFCDHHGAMYRPILDQIRAALTRNSSGNVDDDDDLLLPSFFHTLHTLKTEQRQSFSPSSTNTSPNHANNINKVHIVFRTMGTDLPAVAKKVTAFAQGQHPDYPDFFDPTLVVQEEWLVQGRWVKKSNSDDDNDTGNDNDMGKDDKDDYMYQLQQNDGHVLAKGDAAVLDFLHAHPVCGIQDDYDHWSRHGHAPWAGKPVWKLSTVAGGGEGYSLEEKEKDDLRDFHHILLDDNIHNLEHESIVSVRAQVTPTVYRTLSGQEIRRQQGRHLIRVPTIEPILKPDWFLQQILAAHARGHSETRR